MFIAIWPGKKLDNALFFFLEKANFWLRWWCPGWMGWIITGNVMVLLLSKRCYNATICMLQYKFMKPSMYISPKYQHSRFSNDSIMLWVFQACAVKCVIQIPFLFIIACAAFVMLDDAGIDWGAMHATLDAWSWNWNGFKYAACPKRAPLRLEWRDGKYSWWHAAKLVTF